MENVMDHDAVGDGVEDDTEAIRHAIATLATNDRGGIVYFPPGHYRVTQQIDIPYSGIVLMGESHHGLGYRHDQSGSFIYFSPDAPPEPGSPRPSIFNFTSTDHPHPSVACGVRHLAFRDISGPVGNGSGRRHELRAAVRLENSSRMAIHDCAFERLLGSAIEVQRCTDLRVDGVTVFRCGAPGHPSVNLVPELPDEPDAFPDYLQAGLFSNLRIEVDFSGVALMVGRSVYACHYNNLVFENTNEPGAQGTLLAVAGNRNQFTNLHFNAHHGDAPRVSITGGHNCFTNLTLADAVRGSPVAQIQLQGSDAALNVFSDIVVREQHAGAPPQRLLAFLDGAHTNTFSNISLHRWGLCTMVDRGNDNKFSHVISEGCAVRLIEVLSGQRNTFDHVHVLRSGYAGTLVELDGFGHSFTHGIIQRVACPTAIHAGGDYLDISHNLFHELPAEAVAIDHGGVNSKVRHNRETHQPNPTL